MVRAQLPFYQATNNLHINNALYIGILWLGLIEFRLWYSLEWGCTLLPWHANLLPAMGLKIFRHRVLKLLLLHATDIYTWYFICWHSVLLYVVQFLEGVSKVTIFANTELKMSAGSGENLPLEKRKIQHRYQIFTLGYTRVRFGSRPQEYVSCVPTC